MICKKNQIRGILTANGFSFPSPSLGTHLPGKPQLPVTGDGTKQGLRAQMRSQAGAWERGKMPSGRSRRIDKSAGNAWDLSIPGEHFGKTSDLMNLPIIFSRSQAPAWERTCRGGSPASRDVRRSEAGASGADAFPSRGLGTRKNALRPLPAD